MSEIKKILLTGGHGMVGKNISSHNKVFNYELFTPTHKELDLLDYDVVKQYLKKVKPDLIIHAAGKVGGIVANNGHNFDYFYLNLKMGENIVMAAYEEKIPNFLNLASSCMYPKDSNKKLTEDMILDGKLEPTNEGYALAKIAITKLCSYITEKEKGLKYKTLIPCNLYGKWDKFETDRAHMIPAVISRVIKAKIENLPFVEMWGDGTARREFMYAGDLADSIWYSIENFNELPDIMNVGIGKDYSIKEYYKFIFDAVGYEGKVKFDETKPVGMKNKLVDITLQTEFGWEPKTNIVEGIKQTVEYYCQNVLGENKGDGINA